VLLLLTRLLAAALLLTRLLLAWVLLAWALLSWALLSWALLSWALVLLARILVLIAHSNSPFSRFAAGVNAFGQQALRGNSRFLWCLRGDSLSRLWRVELGRGQQTLCKPVRADPPQLPAPVPNC
jgi:hypothetical protein